MLEIKKYGKLTPIKILYSKKSKKYWLCKCDCGNTTVSEEYNLKSGNTKSCGCLRYEISKFNNQKHGLYKHRLYRIWANMKERCENPNATEFKNYGGKGVKVCNEWLDFMTFYEWALKNGYKDNLTIDRIEIPLVCHDLRYK